nr:type II toxin-antitoxin system RelE/ParE family toxin [Herbaspirillum sp. 3C11]
MAEYRLAPAAERDLEAIWTYTRMKWGTEQADRYTDIMTLTSLTSLGIFQHGGFGKPHALALITLATLAIARAAIRTTWFGRRSAYVEMVAYSATVLFHFIPALTETGTRLPVGAPFFANAEDPLLKMLTGALVLVFLVGATLQVVWLGRRETSMQVPAA